MAVVSSRTPWHQSARVGVTIESPLVATLRLDAGDSLSDTLARLDAFEPEVLVAYASMLRILAEEHTAGRLHIQPMAVNASSEVLTPHMRELLTAAWGVVPFEVYAATETGGIAAECAQHRGMHVFEDLVIAESVDDNYAPVSDEETGSRVLVTVLHSRNVTVSDSEGGIALALTTDASDVADLRTLARSMAKMYDMHRGHGATMWQAQASPW